MEDDTSLKTSQSTATLSVLHSRRTWLPRTETWLYDQIRNLPGDIVSHVVCERLENSDCFGAVSLTHLGARPDFYLQRAIRKLGLLPHLSSYDRVARSIGATILHSHFGDAAWRDSALASALNLVHVVTFYGLDVNFLPRKDPRWIGRYQEVFGKAAAILCEGPHMARCLEAMGCPKDKLRVHHLGVEVAEIPYATRSRRADEPFKVLIASSFREKKGIPDALKAVARLAQTCPVEVTLVGDASHEARSQRERARIEQTLASCHLEGSVRRLGFVSQRELRRIALEHHVFLAPSLTASDGDTEGGAPVAILEMMATGMPVVSTTHCDIPELVEHETTGLLAPECDVDALAAHLAELAGFPERWGPMGRAARDKVEAGFDAHAQGLRLGDLYRELATR